MPEVQEGQADRPRHPVDPDALDDLIQDHLVDLQRAVEEHMDGVEAAFFAMEEGGDPVDSPAYAPYDGCDTCQQREILMAFTDKLLELARSAIAESAA